MDFVNAIEKNESFKNGVNMFECVVHPKVLSPQDEWPSPPKLHKH